MKLVKRLLQKSAAAANLDSDDFARGLLEIRNTPRSDGRSPAQVLYLRPPAPFIRRRAPPLVRPRMAARGR